jgi:hypothetical protein
MVLPCSIHTLIRYLNYAAWKLERFYLFITKFKCGYAAILSCDSEDKACIFSQDLTETFPVKVEPFDEFASLKPEMMHLAQRNDGMLPHFSHKKYYGYVDLSLKSYFFHLMFVCRTHHVQ